jgi:hypothetical protein
LPTSPQKKQQTTLLRHPSPPASYLFEALSISKVAEFATNVGGQVGYILERAITHSSIHHGEQLAGKQDSKVSVEDWKTIVQENQEEWRKAIAALKAAAQRISIT